MWFRSAQHRCGFECQSPMCLGITSKEAFQLMVGQWLYPGYLTCVKVQSINSCAVYAVNFHIVWIMSPHMGETNCCLPVCPFYLIHKPLLDVHHYWQEASTWFLVVLVVIPFRLDDCFGFYGYLNMFIIHSLSALHIQNLWLDVRQTCQQTWVLYIVVHLVIPFKFDDIWRIYRYLNIL